MAQERLPTMVAKFSVNGPPESAYLGAAAQDAIVGALLQKGWNAQSLPKEIDPEKLKAAKQGGKLTGLLVTGRINVVGQTYRVFLKWVDSQGRFGQQYLQVGSINELLPQLESFASRQLEAPSVAVTQKEEKQIEKSTFEREIVPPPPPQPVAELPKSEPAKQEPVKVKAPPPEPKREKSQLTAKRTIKYRDYDFVSKRLPFEVRSIAYGDLNGDGHKEVVLTSQRKVYVYSFTQGEMQLLAEFPGQQLDYFVKVDLWSSPSGATLIVLTNLRKDRASSKLLKYQGGQLTAVAENIPFMLRVMDREGQSQLVGSIYHAESEAGGQAIFQLALQGSKVKNIGKIKLPWNSHLYNYDWVRDPKGNPKDVVLLSPQGKLRYYRMRDEKYKKAWTSRGKFGGSGNYVPVKIKNFFNEVVGSYYAIPVGVTAFKMGETPEIVVVKNDSTVKDVVGRVPIISDGQIFRFTYDELGFVEAWASKKVDGSIQDYLVTRTDGQPQLMAAVRLRDPGLLGDIGRHDS
ncbi:MAG: hypothetical protein R3257_05490, partial [bacterium]|nr:hypothetical protein [bacterium]